MQWEPAVSFRAMVASDVCTCSCAYPCAAAPRAPLVLFVLETRVSSFFCYALRLLLLLLHPHASSCLSNCMRERTQRTYLNVRERVQRTRPNVRLQLHARERDHSACALMRDRAQRACPNAREREGAQCACTCVVLAACSTVWDHAGWCRGALCSA
jgi:hypothetical protein